MLNGKDEIDILLVVAQIIISIFVVLIYLRQLQIQKQQRNVDLFDKKWKMLEELKELGDRSLNFKHVYSENLKSVKDNFWSLKNELDFFASKCFILFGADLEYQFEEIAKLFADYHINIDEIHNHEKYNEECPEKYTKENLFNLKDKKIKMYIELNEKFRDFYNSMLECVKKVKINDD